MFPLTTHVLLERSVMHNEQDESWALYAAEYIRNLGKTWIPVESAEVIPTLQKQESVPNDRQGDGQS